MTGAPRLLLTIDVEEDMPGWRITNPITVENVQALPRLANLCGELGVRPTYLCTYPVVDDPASAAVLRSLHARGDCEIGTHLHAWNTPPFQGVPGRDGDERTVPYYQFELGPERFRAKLDELHTAITGLTGAAPVSFRAGRYGIDAATLAELIPLGYVVDTSVTPLAEHTADGGPDFRKAPWLPYRPDGADVCRQGATEILEIPVSIALTRRWPRALALGYVHLPKVTRLRGLLSRDFLRVVDFAWLYPVRFELELMRGAASTLCALETPVLNVFLHSSELTPGTSGRIRTEADVESMLGRLRGLLEHCLSAFDARPLTLAEAARELRPDHGLTP